MTKALRFQLYQKTAHFRDPRISQDEFIATLMLPSPTTVIGMLAYLCDQKFTEELRVGIIGTAERKEIHFSRGESEDFWPKYQTFVRKKSEEDKVKGSTYMQYKNKLVSNRMMNYEVLREVNLTIFIQASEPVLETLLANLKQPKRYLSLGRKEDFAKVKGTPQIVEIDEVTVSSVKEALKKGISLTDTYVRVDLREENTQNKLLDSGALYTLPYRYKDLAAPKVERTRQYRSYIYLDEKFYPDFGDFPVYHNKHENNKDYFQWM
ncbi:MAG TPA: CRISPR-associated protein Cas5 [Lactovum miscens]|uniref:CRISPR-associated protein Cas5 n=1 Tax=Lactovum miscens TaxID=190387 RepID=UPI002EDB18AB